MKFVCDSCNTKYSIADEKVRRKVLKIRCKNCNHIIVVRDPNRSSQQSRRHSSGSKALDQAFDRSFEDSAAARLGAGRSLVQAVHAPALARAGTEPEDMPTVMSASPPEARPHDLVQEDEWYLAVEGHQFGPMSFDELCKRVKRGEGRGDSGEEAFVWHDGFDNWVEVASVPELRPYVPPPPPPRGRSGLFPVGAMPPGMPPPPPDGTPVAGLPPGSWSAAAGPPAIPGPEASSARPLQVVRPQPVPAEISAEPGLAARSVSAEHPAAAAAALEPSGVQPSPLSPGPSAPQMPLMMKIGAVGGVVAGVLGVAVIVYVIFFDRPNSSMHVPAASGAGSAGQGVAMGDQQPQQNTAGEPQAGSMEFPVMEISRSAEGRARGRKTAKPAANAAGRPEEDDSLSAADKKLLDRFKDSVDDVRVPEQEKKERVRRSRNITQAEVQRLQLANRRSIEACYNRALKRDYSLKDSRADVTLAVAPNGAVKGVRFTGMGSRALASCLQGNLQRWRFSPLGGTTNVDVNFSLLFRGN